MRDIDRERLRELIEHNQDVIIVEALSPQQFRKAHLPGAINLPVSEDFDQRVQKAIPDKNQTVVVYCSSPT